MDKKVKFFFIFALCCYCILLITFPEISSKFNRSKNIKMLAKRQQQEVQDSANRERNARGNATRNACEAYLKLSDDLALAGGGPIQFPWMAALGYLSANNKVIYKCGGTLISEYFILTAAHCVKRVTPAVIRLGNNLIDDDGNKTIIRHIEEIMRHPNHSTTYKRNDIALIRVNESIPFSNYVMPACLQTELRDEQPNVAMILSGWGSTSLKRIDRSNELRKIELETIPLSECNKTFLEFNEEAHQAVFQYGIYDGQYCAYNPKRENDGCQGDSGGPLQYFDDNNSSIATVVGIVSFGINCGSPLPSIYTRVAYYIDWIESIVWPKS